MRDRPSTLLTAVRVLLITVTLLLPVCGCAHTQEQRFDFTRVVMGVQARITLYAPKETKAESAAAAAFAVLASIEDQTSDYRIDNALATLAARAGTGEWTPIGPHLATLLRQSTLLAARSDGAFDPSMGPLTLLWRSQRQNPSRAPAPDQLAAARSLVNWRNLEFDSTRARLTIRGMRLDFGAIAKGYAAEAAVRELERQGTPRCLVSIAGDIFAGDPPRSSRGWRIAIQSGQAAQTETPQTGTLADDWIYLCQAGCSTSGDTEQVITVEGVRHSHIIDIRTGVGSSRRASVTVIAPHGWQSDALATAIYLLDEPAAQRLLQFYPGCRAIIYEPDGNYLRRREISSEINSAAARISAIR